MHSYKPFAWLSVAGCVALLCTLTIGCGGKTNEEPDEDLPFRTKLSGGGAAKVELRKPLPGKYTGVLEGKIEINGIVQAKLDEVTTALQTAMKGVADRDHCLKPKGAETEQMEFRVGTNKGLGNVFVWIMPPNDLYFDIPKEQLDAVAKKVTIGQPHCAFVPHCTVAFPSYYGKDGKQVKTGQEIIIENDAEVPHNANLGEWGNPTLPKRTGDNIAKVTIPFTPQTRPITIQCNFHSWMRGYIGVFGHPYATLTSVGAKPAEKKIEDLSAPEVGTYKITGVPVGAKVKLYVWHESLGYITPASGKEITLKDTTTENFTVEKK